MRIRPHSIESKFLSTMSHFSHCISSVLGGHIDGCEKCILPQWSQWRSLYTTSSWHASTNWYGCLSHTTISLWAEAGSLIVVSLILQNSLTGYISTVAMILHYLFIDQLPDSLSCLFMLMTFLSQVMTWYYPATSALSSFLLSHIS